MPLLVSMHFRFILDINVNFTMQNCEPLRCLSVTPLTPKDLSLFISYYITLTD